MGTCGALLPLVSLQVTQLTLAVRTETDAQAHRDVRERGARVHTAREAREKTVPRISEAKISAMLSDFSFDGAARSSTARARGRRVCTCARLVAARVTVDEQAQRRVWRR
jgi:hypothetical protein